MKITTEQDGVGGEYRILNRGRVIARYSDWETYRDAIRTLGRLTAQLQRPEAFCDCKPKPEVLH